MLFMEGSDAEALSTDQNLVEVIDATASSSNHGVQQEPVKGRTYEVDNDLCMHMDDVSMIIENDVVCNVLLDTGSNTLKS